MKRKNENKKRLQEIVFFLLIVQYKMNTQLHNVVGPSKQKNESDFRLTSQACVPKSHRLSIEQSSERVKTLKFNIQTNHVPGGGDLQVRELHRLVLGWMKLIGWATTKEIRLTINGRDYKSVKRVHLLICHHGSILQKIK